jgi:hypothetical protein
MWEWLFTRHLIPSSISTGGGGRVHAVLCCTNSDRASAEMLRGACPRLDGPPASASRFELSIALIRS